MLCKLLTPYVNRVFVKSRLILFRINGPHSVLRLVNSNLIVNVNQCIPHINIAPGKNEVYNFFVYRRYKEHLEISKIEKFGFENVGQCRLAKFENFVYIFITLGKTHWPKSAGSDNDFLFQCLPWEL